MGLLEAPDDVSIALTAHPVARSRAIPCPEQKVASRGRHRGCNVDITLAPPVDAERAQGLKHALDIVGQQQIADVGLAFGKRGEQAVQDNLTCVKRGYNEIREVPPELINASPIANGQAH